MPFTNILHDTDMLIWFISSVRWGFFDVWVSFIKLENFPIHHIKLELFSLPHISLYIWKQTTVTNHISFEKATPLKSKYKNKQNKKLLSSGRKEEKGKFFRLTTIEYWFNEKQQLPNKFIFIKNKTRFALQSTCVVIFC